MSWWPDPSSSSWTTAPSVTIVLSMESAPRVVTDARTDSEANRLCDWILSHAAFAELLERAIELTEEWDRRESA